MFKPQKIPTVAGSLLLASVLAACGGGSSPPPIAEPEPAPDPAPPYVTSAAPCFSTGYLDGSHVDHSNFYREIAVSGARTGILKHRVSSVQESIFPGLPPTFKLEVPFPGHVLIVSSLPRPHSPSAWRFK